MSDPPGLEPPADPLAPPESPGPDATAATATEPPRPGWAARIRFRGSPAVRFAAAALVAAAGVVAVWLLLVGTEPGQRLENAALRGAEFRTDLDRQAALDRLSQVTASTFGLVAVGCFLVGQLRKRGWLATVVVVSMAAGVAMTELLKAVLGRPELVGGPAWIVQNSFPSGSAAVATAVALGLYVVAPDRLRWLALTAGVVVAAFISESVQTSGWHRLSDTVGAACMALVAMFAGLWLLARAGLVLPSDRGHVDRRVAAGLWLVAGVALALGTVVLLLLALFPVLTTPVDAERALLQTAFPLIGTGWTVVAILLAARVVEPFTLGVSAPPTEAAPGNATRSPSHRPDGVGAGVADRVIPGH